MNGGLQYGCCVVFDSTGEVLLVMWFADRVW